MGGFRERVRLVREEEIVQTAAQLITAKGYHGMSMDDLADRVGISKATLYQHFDSKEDLVASVMTRHMDRLLDLVERDGAGTAAPLRRLEEALRLLVELRHSGRAPDLNELDFCTVIQDRPELRERHDRIIARLVELVERAKAAGEVRAEIATPIIVRAFFALVVGPGSTQLTRRDQLTVEEISASVVALFLNGISTGAVPRFDDRGRKPAEVAAERAPAFVAGRGGLY